MSLTKIAILAGKLANALEAPHQGDARWSDTAKVLMRELRDALNIALAEKTGNDVLRDVGASRTKAEREVQSREVCGNPIL
ncbi:hypothetical protein KW791_03980 [Candidatus Parcubacteria bacterium]|nr:hypothetical protein [Candidatus Parcubacteria bacterium]